MSVQQTAPVRDRLMQIIISPHVSEKATRLGEKYKQIVFKVLPEATKTEIKEAIEHLFDVKVQTVSSCQVKGKTRRFKQTIGRRKSWKKAYVALKEGYDIDFTTKK